QLVVLSLVDALVAEKSMAEIILTRTLAVRVANFGFVADHPNGLRKTKVPHGLRQVMRERARFEFDQPGGELDLAGAAVIAPDGRGPKIGKQLGGHWHGGAEFHTKERQKPSLVH